MLYLWSSTWNHCCYSPTPQEEFRLVINQSVGSCSEKLIPEVRSCLSVVCSQRLSLLYQVRYIFMHCLLISPLICSYMWDLTSKTHIWCISDFVLKIGYYKVVSKQCWLQDASLVRNWSSQGFGIVIKSLLYKPWYFHPYYIPILAICLYLVAYFKSTCSHHHSLIWYAIRTFSYHLLASLKYKFQNLYPYYGENDSIAS